MRHKSIFNIETFLFFLKKHLTQTIIIGLGGGILVFFLIMIFPEMDIDQAELISSSWPPVMKDMFGDPIYGFTDIYGWLELEVFHVTFWALYGIFATLISSNIIAHEFEIKTIDITLSCPVRRTELIFSKMTGLATILTASILPAIIACIAGLGIFNHEIYLLKILLAGFNGLLLCLIFAEITLLISVFIHSKTLSISISLAIIGFFFMLKQMIVPLIPELRNVAKINPFYFYNTGPILIHDIYSIVDIIVLLFIFIVLLIISMFFFHKRDVLN